MPHRDTIGVTGGRKYATKEVPAAATFRCLTEYQIGRLRQMFIEEVIISQICREDESGDLIVSHRGGVYDYEGVVKTTYIPRVSRPNI